MRPNLISLLLLSLSAFCQISPARELSKAESTAVSTENPYPAIETPIREGNNVPWDEAFADPETWNQLPQGQWTLESRTEETTKYVANAPQDFAGQAAEIVRIRTNTKTGSIQSIEIIWEELGMKVPWPTTFLPENASSKEKREFSKSNEGSRKQANDYVESLGPKRDSIMAALKATHGNPKISVMGVTPVFKAKVADFQTKSGATIRFWGNEPAMLMATIRRTSDTTSNIASGQLTGQNEKARANVRHLPNGDVIIANIPMHVQGSRGYCSGASYNMILEYWGLAMPMELLAVRYKVGEVWNPDKVKNWGLEPLMEAAAKEGGLRCTIGKRNSVQNIIRQIDMGRPINVGRFMRAERQALHTQWKEEVANDPDFQLPDPKSKEEKAKWAREGDPGHGSVITGYNPRRREILLTESWGEGARNQRMSYEEFEFITGDLVLIAP